MSDPVGNEERTVIIPRANRMETKMSDSRFLQDDFDKRSCPLTVSQERKE